MSYREMVRELRDALEESNRILGEVRYNDIELIAAADALLAQKTPEPVFWYRPVSNGEGYEGPIHNSSIEEVRKKSGAWHPLYTAPPDLQARVEELEREKKEILASLIDANGVCRSAWQIANRIATEFSSHELQTAFGPFADHAHESLQRQRTVINAHNRFATAQESGT